ncbi:MAG: hypothetical protein ACT4RN_09190 [Pseudonocardia sp.]
MSTDNTTDRLLADAREKTARGDSPKLGKIALIVGVIALIASPISILGWILGATAVGLGVAGMKRPASAKQAKIGLGLGVAAILVGLFFFNLIIALY